MKIYGSKLADIKTCPYKCCGRKIHQYASGWFLGKKHKPVVSKMLKHRARQEAKKDLALELKYFKNRQGIS